MSGKGNELRVQVDFPFLLGEGDGDQRNWLKMIPAIVP
jgi:hypothetical protein